MEPSIFSYTEKVVGSSDRGGGACIKVDSFFALGPATEESEERRKKGQQLSCSKVCSSIGWRLGVFGTAVHV